MTLALVDYGAGNLRSVANALRAAGATDVVVTSDAAVAEADDRIVLPGVGAYAASMAALTALPGMVDALNETVRTRGRPFLGICVGMQLMASAGEEFGRHAGLGWIPGTVAKLAPADPDARVPHMGWNDVTPVNGHPLAAPFPAPCYFDHSYAVSDAPDDVVLARTSTEGGPFASLVGRGTVAGAQFHPERSSAAGRDMLGAVLDWAGAGRG